MLANLFILLLRTVMDQYRPPIRGGLVLSGSVPFLTVIGQFIPEPEQFQNRSGPKNVKNGLLLTQFYSTIL